MDIDFSFMLVAIKACIQSIPATIILAVGPFIIGIVLGTGIAILRIFQVKFWAKFLKICIDTLKAIPIVLILYLMLFLLTDGFDLISNALGWSIKSKDIDISFIAVAALSVFGTVTISETIRGAFMAIGQGQYEAGYSIGLTVPQTLWRIIIPQALPVAVPVLCNNLIGLVKASSIMYMIAIKDILNAAFIVATANYRYLDAYIAAALVYWAICAVIEQVSKILEKRMGKFRRIVA